MIKKMRLKITAVTMAIIAIVFAAISAVVLINMSVSTNIEAFKQLEHMIEDAQRKQIVEPPSNEPEPTVGSEGKEQSVGKDFQGIRSFTAIVSDDDTQLSFDTNFFSESEVSAFLEQIRLSKKEQGKIDSLYFLTRTDKERTIIVASDRTIEREILSESLLTFLVVGLAGLLVLGILVWFLTAWIVKPVESAFNKQKQFVSDASHELKTPVTIVLASAEVLEAQIGQNKWVDNIKQQTSRMAALTSQLLELAKEGENSQRTKLPFDLRTAVVSAALAFESVAFEKGKTLTCSAAEVGNFLGDEAAVSQGVGLLVDNAIKYSREGAAIVVRLKLKGKRPVIEVFNEGEGIPPEIQKRLFERFFRSDDSRARTSGGAGLGLAILKSLADKNQWTLSIDSRLSEYTCFIIEL